MTPSIVIKSYSMFENSWQHISDKILVRFFILNIKQLMEKIKLHGRQISQICVLSCLQNTIL
jgi:hypothetical protein